MSSGPNPTRRPLDITFPHGQTPQNACPAPHSKTRCLHTTTLSTATNPATANITLARCRNSTPSRPHIATRQARPTAPPRPTPSSRPRAPSLNISNPPSPRTFQIYHASGGHTKTTSPDHTRNPGDTVTKQPANTARYPSCHGPSNARAEESPQQHQPHQRIKEKQCNSPWSKSIS